LRLWKQAVRPLFRSPGFLAVAALALALGIGSTTTIFSIVRAVFLRGLPYADPESLVQLRSSVPEQQIVGAGFSYPRFEAVRDRQTVFSALSYSAFAAFTLTADGGEPEQVQGLQTAYDVVGQVVHLDGRPHTVIGVMPQDASRFSAHSPSSHAASGRRPVAPGGAARCDAILHASRPAPRSGGCSVSSWLR